MMSAIVFLANTLIFINCFKVVIVYYFILESHTHCPVCNRHSLSTVTKIVMKTVLTTHDHAHASILSTSAVTWCFRTT